MQIKELGICGCCLVLKNRLAGRNSASKRIMVPFQNVGGHPARWLRALAARSMVRLSRRRSPGFARVGDVKSFAEQAVDRGEQVAFSPVTLTTNQEQLASKRRIRPSATAPCPACCGQGLCDVALRLAVAADRSQGLSCEVMPRREEQLCPMLCQRASRAAGHPRRHPAATSRP